MSAAARLTGRTVVVTRATEDAGSLKASLEALGAAVIEVASIVVRAAADADDVASALSALDAVGWVAFASRNGVRAFMRLLDQAQVALPERVRLAAVGPGTAEEVAALCGRPAAVIAGVNTGEGLAAELVRVARPRDGLVLLPSAARGRRGLEEGLVAARFRTRRLVVYETTPATLADGVISLPATVDYVLFTSPSTVKGFLARASVPAGARVVSMGPATSEAVRAAGLFCWREASVHSIDGLLEVLESTTSP